MMERAIVLYDGNCELCNTWAERLRRWDRKARLELLSLHHPSVAYRFPTLQRQQLSRELHIWDPKGHRWHCGAEAMRYLTRRIPHLWWAAPMLHVPLTAPLLRWGYAQVAGRRRTCTGAACVAGID